MKNLSRHHQVSIGIVGVALCLSVGFPCGSVFGQQIVSHVKNSEMASTLGDKPKGHRWTVPCEREDGTQGIFRVSSNVTDEVSPVDLEPTTDAGEMAVERPPAPNLQLDVAVEDPDDEDPFGSPTLKCGRLLTLLAIFASAESLEP